MITRLIALAYWSQPFSLYWNRIVVSTLLAGVTSSTNRDSSLIQEMKGSRYPEITVDFWIGMIIRTIRFHQLTPIIIPASSISLLSCSMELTPDLEAMGIYFTLPMIASRAKVPYSDGIGPLLTANSDR